MQCTGVDWGHLAPLLVVGFTLGFGGMTSWLWGPWLHHWYQQHGPGRHP
jgi:hypothetical protein